MKLVAERTLVAVALVVVLANCAGMLVRLEASPVAAGKVAITYLLTLGVVVVARRLWRR